MKKFQTKFHQNQIIAPEFRILGEGGGRRFFSIIKIEKIMKKHFYFCSEKKCEFWKPNLSGNVHKNIW